MCLSKIVHGIAGTESNGVFIDIYLKTIRDTYSAFGTWFLLLLASSSNTSSIFSIISAKK